MDSDSDGPDRTRPTTNVNVAAKYIGIGAAAEGFMHRPVVKGKKGKPVYHNPFL